MMTAMSEQHAAAGWYPTGNGVERWWDGTQWTDAHRAIPQQVAQPAGPSMMVTRSPKRTSHTFHLIMTILTAGVWGIFVWLPLTILHKFQREKSVTRMR